MKFFTSIKTSLWLMGLSIIFYAIGSVVIPQNLEIFSEINDMPLFRWFSLNRAYFFAFSWILALIVLMALMAVNIIICGIDSLVKSLPHRQVIDAVAPQILHIGVVIVLFGHLVSASFGYKEDVPMAVGITKEVRGMRLSLAGVDFIQVPGEDSRRWVVGLGIDGNDVVLYPASPAFVNGIGFFAKSAQEKNRTAIIGLVYDPGVGWEIAGALVFVIGAAALFYVQLRRS